MRVKRSYLQIRMARNRRKPQPPDIDSARSWRGKLLRDGFENRLGLVHTVSEDENGIYLTVRFQNEEGDRTIWLEPREDGEYVYPGDAHARYRPLLEDELAKRRKNASS